jgi:hypothetical protein
MAKAWIGCHRNGLSCKFQQVKDGWARLYRALKAFYGGLPAGARNKHRTGGAPSDERAG